MHLLSTHEKSSIIRAQLKKITALGKTNKQTSPFHSVTCSGGRGSKLPLYGPRSSRMLSMTQSIFLSLCYDNSPSGHKGSGETRPLLPELECHFWSVGTTSGTL